MSLVMGGGIYSEGSKTKTLGLGETYHLGNAYYDSITVTQGITSQGAKSGSIGIGQTYSLGAGYYNSVAVTNSVVNQGQKNGAIGMGDVYSLGAGYYESVTVRNTIVNNGDISVSVNAGETKTVALNGYYGNLTIMAGSGGASGAMIVYYNVQKIYGDLTLPAGTYVYEGWTSGNDGYYSITLPNSSTITVGNGSPLTGSFTIGGGALTIAPHSSGASTYLLIYN